MTTKWLLSQIGQIALRIRAAKLPQGVGPRSFRLARLRFLKTSIGATPCCVLLISAFAVSAALAQHSKPSQGKPAGDASSLAGAAEDALNRKDFSSAVVALQSLVQAQPDSVPAWFNLGYAYSELNRDADAVKAYQKTLELKPDLFEARLNLGILFLEMQQPIAGRDQLEKAVELQPQKARAHLYYGRALNQAGGQPAEAETQFQETVRLDPGLAIAHFDLAQLDLGQKRYSDALPEFQKAAQLDPQLPQAQLGWALALEGLRQESEAATHFEQYLAARPDDLETRFHVARIYLHQGENDQALANLQMVYQKNPKQPGLAAALGDVYASLKKFPEAEQFDREALVASPNDADLHRALGRILLDEQKLVEAGSEFRQALKLDPHNQDAAKGLASSLYEEKRYAEAAPLIEQLIGRPGSSPGLYFVLATCYDHLRDRSKALEAYERFLDLSHGQNPDQEWQAQQRAKLLRRELGK